MSPEGERVATSTRLAIADEIKRRHPQCDILFVGAKGRMEMEKVPAAGYAIKGLWITGVDRNWRSLRNWLFPFKLISSCGTPAASSAAFGRNWSLA